MSPQRVVDHGDWFTIDLADLSTEVRREIVAAITAETGLEPVSSAVESA